MKAFGVPSQLVRESVARMDESWTLLSHSWNVPKLDTVPARYSIVGQKAGHPSNPRTHLPKIRTTLSSNETESVPFLAGCPILRQRPAVDVSVVGYPPNPQSWSAVMAQWSLPIYVPTKTPMKSISFLERLGQ